MVNPFQGGGGFGGYRIPNHPRQSYSGLTNAAAMRSGGTSPFTGQNAFTGGTSPAVATANPFAGGTTPAAAGNQTVTSPFGYQTTTPAGNTSTEVDYGSSPYNSWMGNFNQGGNCHMVCDGDASSGDGGGGNGGGGPNDPGNPDDPNDPGNPDGGGPNKHRINQLKQHCQNGNNKACHRLQQARQAAKSDVGDVPINNATPPPASGGGNRNNNGGGNNKGNNNKGNNNKGGGGGKGKKK